MLFIILLNLVMTLGLVYTNWNDRRRVSGKICMELVSSGIFIAAALLISGLLYHAVINWIPIRELLL